jgi:hypothetical protein
MSEERKHAILLAAATLTARRLRPLLEEDDSAGKTQHGLLNFERKFAQEINRASSADPGQERIDQRWPWLTFYLSTSEIAKLQKKIKVDHALAMELWETGNVEARVLALQVADPEKMTRSGADGLLKDGPVRFLGCYLSGLLARRPIAEETMHTWMKSQDEFPREMGYEIFGVRLKDDPNSVSDADAQKVLATIEAEIQRSPNWARYAMNGALISIGVFKPTLRKKAIEAAKRIGKVEVDHGETNCKTPDAVHYIEKALKWKRCP